jgi:hypothetical protein
MRRTHALIQMAIALLDVPTGRHWGYQLSKAFGPDPESCIRS